MLKSRWFSPLALLLLWELGALLGLNPEGTLAAPHEVVRTFGEMLASGELPEHLLVSFARVAAGLSIGVSLGVVLALASGLSRQGELAIDSPLQMLRTLP